MELICTQCENKVDWGRMGPCPACRGILKTEYAAEQVQQLWTTKPGPGIDRYRALLPTQSLLPYLGEGDTPLIPSRHFQELLGLRRLYFKHEGVHPSGSFKDRGAALAVAMARDNGQRGMVTASSGNAGAALAAYSAAAGLACVLLLEPGAPPNKLRQALATGARIVHVNEVFSRGPEAVRDLILELAARLDYYPAFIWAPVNPYLIEAFKTISYEIVARIGQAPDVVVCPTGGGDMLTAQWRGYLELKTCGIIDRLPRLIGVQSLQAPPLVRAFEANADRVATLPRADSRLSGINVPFTGDHALQSIRESDGAAVGVEDEAVFEIQALLAREEGIWVEPTSAAPVAALEVLQERGLLGEDECVVCVLSGAGFKDAHLAEAEAVAIGRQSPAAFGVDEIISRIT